MPWHYFWRHDSKLNDIHHNDIHHNYTQHNAEYCYAECLVCSLSSKLSVKYKPFMLSDIMLSVIILNVVAPSFLRYVGHKYNDVGQKMAPRHSA